MSRLKIYTFPDPVLAQKAQGIARVEKEQQKLADDMLETMYHAPGIGLAANQVGVLSRLLVVDVDYEMDDLKKGEPVEGEVVGNRVITRKKPIILINPKIILQEGTTALEEGCLSVPDYQAEVKRAEKIKVEYQDIDGLTKTLSADGLLAVAIQHEMDHLEGKLFIDRLSPLKKDMIRKKLRQERLLRDEEERMGVFDPGHEAFSRRKKGF
jgi:peptide deformylase